MVAALRLLPHLHLLRGLIRLKTNTALMPVSYTHLAVYKRQTQRYVVYPGTESFALRQGAQTIGLEALMALLGH